MQPKPNTASRGPPYSLSLYAYICIRAPPILYTYGYTNPFPKRIQNLKRTYHAAASARAIAFPSNTQVRISHGGGDAGRARAAAGRPLQGQGEPAAGGGAAVRRGGAGGAEGHALPRRPVPRARRDAAGAACVAGGEVLRAGAGLERGVLRGELLVRPPRRRHHRQPLHPAGHQLRHPRRHPSGHRPLFVLRAAAGVRSDGELEEPRGGAGGDVVAAGGVHRRRQGEGVRRPAAVHAARLHVGLLHRRPAGGARAPQAGDPGGFHVAAGDHRVHGRHGDRNHAAAAQGLPRHDALHHQDRHRLRPPLHLPQHAPVAVAEHGSWRLLPHLPRLHRASEATAAEAVLGVSDVSSVSGRRRMRLLVSDQRPQAWHPYSWYSEAWHQPELDITAQVPAGVRRRRHEGRVRVRDARLSGRRRRRQELRGDEERAHRRQQGDGRLRPHEPHRLLHLLLHHHRCVLEDGGELPRRVPDGDVERGDVGVHGAGAGRAGAAVPAHAAGGAGGHHHQLHARAGQAPRDPAPVRGGQGRLRRLRRRAPRRRLLHHDHRPRRRRGHLRAQGAPARGAPVDEQARPRVLRLRRRRRRRRPHLLRRRAVPRRGDRARHPRPPGRRLAGLLRQRRVPPGEDRAVGGGRGEGRRRRGPALRRPRHRRRDGDRQPRDRDAAGGARRAGEEGDEDGGDEPEDGGGGEAGAVRARGARRRELDVPLQWRRRGRVPVHAPGLQARRRPSGVDLDSRGRWIGTRVSICTAHMRMCAVLYVLLTHCDLKSTCISFHKYYGTIIAYHDHITIIRKVVHAHTRTLILLYY
uniref:Uncharacterized protein n=1 Tax=Oryza barthii TaxID=65489 RepID=A0A0D3EQS5_9ORYZ